MFIIAETWRKVASIQKVIYTLNKFRQSARGAHIVIKKKCVTMQHLLPLTEFPKLPPLVSRRSFSQPAFRSFCSRLIRRWAVSYARSISSCLPRRLFLAGEHAFSPELPFLPFQERDKCRLMDESWGFNGTPPVIRITAWLLLSSSVRNFIPPRAYIEFSRMDHFLRTGFEPCSELDWTNFKFIKFEGIIVPDIEREDRFVNYYPRICYSWIWNGERSCRILCRANVLYRWWRTYILAVRSVAN